MIKMHCEAHISQVFQYMRGAQKNKLDDADALSEKNTMKVTYCIEKVYRVSTIWLPMFNRWLYKNHKGSSLFENGKFIAIVHNFFP